MRASSPQSVLERAMTVLRAFGPDDVTLSLTELRRRTDLPRATVYRLANHLAELERSFSSRWM